MNCQRIIINHSLCPNVCRQLWSKLRMFSMKTNTNSVRNDAAFIQRPSRCNTSGPIDRSKHKHCLAAVDHCSRQLEWKRRGVKSREWKWRQKADSESSVCKTWGTLVVVLWSEEWSLFLSFWRAHDWNQLNTELNMRMRWRSVTDLSSLICVWGHEQDFNSVMTEPNTFGEMKQHYGSFSASCSFKPQCKMIFSLLASLFSVSSSCWGKICDDDHQLLSKSPLK